MNWSDERYVRLYTRDTVDWLALSFDAQALLALLMRKVDRSGILELGKQGRRSVAIAIGHPGEWPRLEKALVELEDDGCVRVEDDRLVIKNFIEAQEAIASDARRAREFRERRRLGVTKRDASRNVTDRHADERGITEHNASVTPPSRASLPSVPPVPSKNPDARAREVQSAGQSPPFPEPETPMPSEPPGWLNDASAAPRARGSSPPVNGHTNGAAYAPAQQALATQGSIDTRPKVCARCGASVRHGYVMDGARALCNPCRYGGPS